MDAHDENRCFSAYGCLCDCVQCRGHMEPAERAAASLLRYAGIARTTAAMGKALAYLERFASLPPDAEDRAA